jgi:hypothetical protein
MASNKVPAYFSNTNPGQGAPPAALIDGLCRTDAGRLVMDLFLTRPWAT